MGIRVFKYGMGAAIAAATLCNAAWGHGNEARMVEFLNWKKIPRP